MLLSNNFACDHSNSKNHHGLTVRPKAVPQLQQQTRELTHTNKKLTKIIFIQNAANGRSFVLNYKFMQSRLTSFGASSAPTVTSTAS